MTALRPIAIIAAGKAELKIDLAAQEWLTAERGLSPEILGPRLGAEDTGKCMHNLTQARLMELFIYQQQTGFFVRRVSAGRGASGSIAGYIDKDGYRRIRVDSRTYRAGRLAVLWMTGKMPPILVDHKNRTRDDDSWDNLRPADYIQNGGNRGRQVNKRTACPKGVHPRNGRFAAVLRAKHIGTFDTIHEAKNAYAQAAADLFGEFAWVA